MKKSDAGSKWNQKIKEHLQGKQLKDQIINKFFKKKRGRKRIFEKERERMSRAKRQKLCEVQMHDRGTRVYARKRNGLWAAGTRDTNSYEDTLPLVVQARRHRGQWVATADDFTTENDDESCISSLSDSVPESEVKPANVTRLEAKKAVLRRHCDWSEGENFDMLKRAISNARAPKVSQRAHAESFPSILLTTLHSALKRLGGKEVTKANVFPKKRKAFSGSARFSFSANLFVINEISDEFFLAV